MLKTLGSRNFFLTFYINLPVKRNIFCKALMACTVKCCTVNHFLLEISSP